jgi:hypothetical protein
VQGDRHFGGLRGSSSVESQIHIQHFLIPRVEERESAWGRGWDASVCSSLLVDEPGLSSRTVWESSDIMDGAVDSA